MNISEIKGTRFKKSLQADRCYFRWHNRNKSGGNFGFEIRGMPAGYEWEINGHYDSEGDIICLRLTKIFQGKGIEIGHLDFDAVIRLIWRLSNFEYAEFEKFTMTQEQAI